MAADHNVLPRLSFTFDEWLRTTSRAMHVRSAGLKALDILVDAYIRTPSPNNLRFLRNALQRWKQEHGGESAWRANKRNAESHSFERLDAEINGKGDTDTLLATPDFMAPAMINARLGVIYLFGNLYSDPQYFKIATGGVIDLANAGLGFANSLMHGNVRSGPSVAKTVLSQAVKDPLTAQAAKLDEKRNQSQHPKLPQEQQRTVTSQQLQQLDGNAGPSDAGSQAQRQRISEQLQAADEIIAREIEKQTDGAPEKEEKKTALDKYADGAWEQAPGKLRALYDFLAGTYLGHVAPYISGGLATLGGVIQAIEAGVTRWSEYAHSRGVLLLPGYPGTVVQSIRGAMDVSVGAGVFKTLKGSVSLVATGLSAGSAGAIASLVLSLVEILVTVRWRLYDLKRMQAFFAQAKHHWLHRQLPDAIQHRPIAFNSWFRRYALHTPAISALALNSGICGDKMRFLQMFTPSHEAIPQSAFDAGVLYVDELKEWSSRYLETVGYKFSSDDDLISALIKPGYRPPEGFMEKRVWPALKGFIG
jgi:hypothetical protein